MLAIDGKAIGVIEAKKITLGPAGVLTQAERYARGLADTNYDFRGLRVPFLYSTNGELIYFHDVRHPLSTSRRVTEFHSPVALREMLGRDLKKASLWFAENPNQHHRLRPYQTEANVAVEKAIADCKRRMIVAMATGTGKTFTLVNQIYRLLRSGAAKRVLFLVDRRALRGEAAKAFATFEPQPNSDSPTSTRSTASDSAKRTSAKRSDSTRRFFRRVPERSASNIDTFVYVCTIQRLAIQSPRPRRVWSGEGDDIDDDADKVERSRSTRST